MVIFHSYVSLPEGTNLEHIGSAMPRLFAFEAFELCTCASSLEHEQFEDRFWCQHANLKVVVLLATWEGFATRFICQRKNPAPGKPLVCSRHLSAGIQRHQQSIAFKSHLCNDRFLPSSPPKLFLPSPSHTFLATTKCAAEALIPCLIQPRSTSNLDCVDLWTLRHQTRQQVPPLRPGQAAPSRGHWKRGKAGSTWVAGRD